MLSLFVMELFLDIAAEHIDVQQTTWPPIRGQFPRQLTCNCHLGSQSSPRERELITGGAPAVGNWPRSSVEDWGCWHTGIALPFAPGSEMLFYILGQHNPEPSSECLFGIDELLTLSFPTHSMPLRSHSR